MTESNEQNLENVNDAAQATDTESVEETALGEVEAVEPSETADAAQAVEAVEETTQESDDADDEQEAPRYQHPRVDVLAELRRLSELATRYPEIGPTVAQLALKVGFRDIGERLMRAGFEAEERGVEYFYLAADLARREKRPEDAIKYAIKAVVEAVQAEDLSQDELNRLPHILRLGFAVLMFDLENLLAIPAFQESLSENLPKLEARYAHDAFFHTIWAQALWFNDKAASEAMWDRAAELNDPESTWNARGTWYKEAEKNIQMAKDAYRRGLKRTGGSALLLHNLAQVCMEEASHEGIDVQEAHNLLDDAERNMRKALRLDTRRGLRRHMQATMDRLVQQKRALPAIERKEVEVGDVIRGRVRSLTAYGAFLSIPGGQQGLLHNTELAHEHVAHPSQHLKVGDEIEVKVIEVEKKEDGKLRLGFSRKAILPVPEGGVAPAPRAEQTEQRSRPRRDDNRPRGGGGGANAGTGGNTQNRGENKGGQRSEARSDQRAQPKSNDNRNENRDKRSEGRPRNENRGGGNKNSNRGHQDQPKDSPMGSLGELLLHKLEEAKKDK